jgi:ABC-2 type transport system permease protein
MTAAVEPVSVLRHGAGRWWRDYRSMLAWHAVSLRLWLSTIMVVQILSGLGFVLGIALFFDRIPQSSALFVSTGVPVINLLIVGMVLGPQLTAEQRTSGSYEYLRSFPVGHTVAAAAWATVCLVASLPAMTVSLVAAQLRYDLPLQWSPMIVPATVLTSVAGTMLGYALAHAIDQPMATRLITQLLVFVVFGFAPILFPLAQMPTWLGTLNWWLPYRHMATVMRAALADVPATGVTSAYVVLGAWTVACTALALRAVARRP